MHSIATDLLILCTVRYLSTVKLRLQAGKPINTTVGENSTTAYNPLSVNINKCGTKWLRMKLEGVYTEKTENCATRACNRFSHAAQRMHWLWLSPGAIYFDWNRN